MSMTITRRFHLQTEPGRRQGGHRRRVVSGEEPVPVAEPEVEEAERVHPLARCMAMAIECKRLIESGVVADAAEMARVAGVTRARMTQILNLTLLAPDLQERLLYLEAGEFIDRKSLHEVGLRVLWNEQRVILLR